MKKIILSVAIIAAIGAITWGVTTALFSDTEQSTGNTISAGTLDLAINSENPVTSNFTLGDVKPGDSGTYSVLLQNVGTIAASHVYVDVANLVDTEGLNPEPEGNQAEPGDLSPVIDLTITDGTTTWTGTLAALNTLAAPGIDFGALAASATKTVTITASINTSVGNDIMGDIATFDIVGLLQQ